MYKTIKGKLKGNKIILDENIPFLKEQNILITLLDTPIIEEKEAIIKGIQSGLKDKENGNILTFEESFNKLEQIIEL